MVRVPYKVPRQETVVQIVNQDVITNEPVTNFPNRPVLNYVNNARTEFGAMPVNSLIPDTVEECWNEAL